MTSNSLAADSRVKPPVDWMVALAVLAIVLVYIRAIYFTPVEALQGPSQKIYYLHLGAVLGVCRGRVDVTGAPLAA